jgi:hypothetical protein
MLKIPTDTIVPVLKHALGEYKYLSPNVCKIKNGYKMFYCNRKGKSSLFALMYRYITGKQILYGEINRATSTNLKKWKKESQPIISPKNYKNYVSFLSPFFTRVKKINIFYLLKHKKQKVQMFYVLFQTILKIGPFIQNINYQIIKNCFKHHSF